MCIILVNNIISLNKLIEGGAAIFIILNKNHNIDIDGIIDNIPLVKNILREWVTSYIIFAIENIAEETKP